MQQEANRHPWPPFLAPMRGALERLRLPEGPFSPQGEWEHRYAVCVLGPERQAKAEHVQPYGKLVLKRKPAAGGSFALAVDLVTAARAGSELHTEASLTCAADRLGTPQDWELRVSAMEMGEPAAALALTETGTVRNGTMVRRGQTQRKIALPGPFTSNWSLLEAVQRLPFEGLAPLHFDLFEDMDLRKPEQRLIAVGLVTLDLAGGPVRLYGFRQTGRGILPMHYWLDEQHRLIAAAGSLRGLVWDASGSLARKERS